MQRKNLSYFELLVTAAFACARHRQMLNLYNGRTSPEPDRAGGVAVSSLRALAAECKAQGRDARTSPLHESFGPLAVHYAEAYEQWRPIECKELTPKAIFEAVSKGNKLTWGEWTIKASRRQEMTDGYGLPAWDRMVTVTNDAGFKMVVEYASQPFFRAREIYKAVTGSAFSGDDGLGLDEPHYYDLGNEGE
ncbi:hypothetical protein V0M98_37060 (plasmid) [Pseudomonas silesiensis]|uniref:hypothetical protein n=1 Tax=Pseudomonas silesiensis TaxID=1853130 RepID=UPI0030D00659